MTSFISPPPSGPSSSFSSHLLRRLHHRSIGRTVGINGQLHPFDSHGYYLRHLTCGDDSIHMWSDMFDDSLRPVFCVRYHPSSATGGPLNANQTSSNTPNTKSNIIAASDEHGYVSFIDTALPNHTQTISTRHRFQAHQNAIFDMKWINSANSAHSGDSANSTVPSTTLLTVSGDQTACGWDVTTGQCLFTLTGHQRSVKSIETQPGQPDVILTGARDGTILLFDVREARPSANAIKVKPSYTVQQAHTRATAATIKSKRKRSSASLSSSANTAAAAPTGESGPSVTSLCFLQSHILLTSGAADADIRAWDLRAMRTRYQKDATIVASSRETLATVPSSSSSSSSSLANSGRKRRSTDTFEPIWSLRSELRHTRHGISSLALDASGQRLIASSLDHTIRLYDLLSNHSSARPAHLTPTQTFVGHKASSFYVKASWSPCGRFIASGSSDSKVYLWDTMGHLYSNQYQSSIVSSSDINPSTYPSGIRPMSILSGHNSEVSVVEWNPHLHLRESNSVGSELFELASCSDDSTVRIWRPAPATVDDTLGDIMQPHAIEIEHEAPVPTLVSPLTTCTPIADTATSSANPTITNTLNSPTTQSRLFSDGSLSTRSNTSTPFEGSATSVDDNVDMSPVPDTRSISRLISPSQPSSTSVSSFSSLSPSASLRSVSPSDRTSGSSLPLSSSNDVSTSLLSLQLSSALTVSPNRVQLARVAHRAGRSRRRLDLHPEGEKEDEDQQRCNNTVHQQPTSSNTDDCAMSPFSPIVPNLAPSSTFSIVRPPATVVDSAVSPLASLTPSPLPSVTESSGSLLQDGPPSSDVSSPAVSRHPLHGLIRLSSLQSKPSSHPARLRIRPKRSNVNSAKGSMRPIKEFFNVIHPTNTLAPTLAQTS